jgi:small-conductance mechanosensitive channel
MENKDMAASSDFNWQASLTNTYEELFEQVINLAPLLAGAVALLLGGWLLAMVLRMATRKLMRSIDSIFQVFGSAKQRNLNRSYAVIISNLVFWVVITFFVAATANLLGWNMVADWMGSIIVYLPNLITGLFIILAGFLLSNFVRATVATAAQSAGITQSSMLGRVVQIVILFTALVIGIEQIGINVGFLTNVLLVIIGVLLAGGALAFGLGARTLIANIIGAQYVRKHCRIGEWMQLGNLQGSIIEVTQTSIVLDTEFGRTVIPAHHFQEQITSFRSEIVDSRAGVGDVSAPSQKA